VDYTLEAPEGEYYAYAVVWVVGEDFAEIEQGDYFGYYGETTINRPSAPNLVVPPSGTAYCDITLHEYDADGPNGEDDDGEDDDGEDDGGHHSSGGGCFIGEIFENVK
jgi:hypothetical protein